MTYPTRPAVHTVLVAWGADVRADPDTWTWYDVSDDVDWIPYTVKDGRSEGSTQAETLSVTPALVLRNDRGDYTPEDARSRYWPGVVEGTPIWWYLDAGEGTYTVLQGFIAGLIPRWPGGKNRRYAVVDIAVTGRLGVLNRGARPLQSPLRRALDAAAPAAWWRLDEGDRSTEAASGLIGGTPMVPAPTAPSFGQVPGPVGAGGSYPLFIDGAALVGSLTAPVSHADVGYWQVDCWFLAEAAALERFGVALVATVAGSDVFTKLEFEISSNALGEEFFIAQLRTTAGSTYGSLAEITDLINSGWHHVRVTATQVTGSTADFALHFDGVAVDSSGTVTATIGTVTALRIGALRTAGGTPLDRLSVAYPSVATVPYNAYAAGSGHAGETPGQRIVRLCGEENIPATVLVGADDAVDGFDRVSAAGWGSADQGGAWSHIGSGGAIVLADWDVDGQVGRAFQPTAGGYRLTYLPGIVAADVRIAATFDTFISNVVGAAIEPTLMVRVVSTTSYLMFRAEVDAAEQVTARIYHHSPVIDTLLGSADVTRFTWAGQPFRVVAEAVGSVLRMRVYDPAGTVPDAGTWDLTVTSSALLTAGGIGVRFGIAVGNTNTKPLEFRVNDLVAENMRDRMGPQPVDTTVAILQECERTDLGRLSEAGWGVLYRPRTTLYNQAAALEVDTADQQLGDPFSPRRDLSLIRNEWEVSRQGGATVVYLDADSQSRGRFQDSATINPDSDAALATQAQARVGIGTVPGYRYPTLSFDLARHPTLLAAWQVLQLGDRVKVYNADVIGHPPGVIDQLVEGRVQTIHGRRSWQVTMVTSPAEPYTVGVLEGTGGDTFPPLRADTSSSVLAQAYGATETSLSIATPSGPLLSTSAGDYPCDVEIFGVRIRVTAVTGGSSPQTATVVRGIDGWDKPLPAGSPVRLWRPARLAL